MEVVRAIDGFDDVGVAKGDTIWSDSDNRSITLKSVSASVFDDHSRLALTSKRP